MLNQENIQDFFEQANRLFAGNTVKEDLEKQFRALLQSQLSKLELVSRDEFEAQSAVLLRTREKLEQLEEQLDQLNKRIQQTS